MLPIYCAKHYSFLDLLKALNYFSFRKQRGEKAKHDAKLKKMNGLLDSNMKKRMHLLENYDRLVCCYQLYDMPVFCIVFDISAIL